MQARDISAAWQHYILHPLADISNDTPTKGEIQ